MISEEVQVLLTRMETNPEEFVRSEWNPILNAPWNHEPFYGTRWGQLMSSILMTGSNFLFTEDEVVALRDKYSKLLQDKVKENILKELLTNESLERVEFEQKQLQLPYMSESTVLGGSIGSPLQGLPIFQGQK